MERHPAFVARRVLPAETDVRMLPLIGVVEIHPDDIEIAWLAAKFRATPAGQHIPGVELPRALRRGGLREVRPATGWDDVNDRIHVDHPRPRIHVPKRLAASDGRPHQLALDFLVVPQCEGINETLVADRPGDKRDL